MSSHPTAEKVLEHLNRIRKNPQCIIPDIERTLEKFIDQKRYEIYPHCHMMTREGKSAWLEAIAFLKKQKPLHPLSRHQGLESAAIIHAQDLAKHNMMGHYGSNNSTMEQRIQLFCDYKSGRIGENVGQELPSKKGDHSLETIISLIIDDGVSDRGHRSSVFSSEFRYVGIGVGQTNKHYLVVLDYASENLPLKKGIKNAPKQKPMEEKAINTRHQSPQLKDFGDFQNFQKKFEEMGFMGFNEGKMAQTGKNGAGDKGRTKVGQSSSTKSSTVNGKTTTTKIIKTTYSDGSTETETLVEEY